MSHGLLGQRLFLDVRRRLSTLGLSFLVHIEMTGKGERGEKKKEKSALELLKTRLTHADWLLRGRRERVPGRTLGTENVPTVAAVMLDYRQGERVRRKL